MLNGVRYVREQFHLTPAQRNSDLSAYSFDTQVGSSEFRGIERFQSASSLREIIPVENKALLLWRLDLVAGSDAGRGIMTFTSTMNAPDAYPCFQVQLLVVSS